MEKRNYQNGKIYCIRNDIDNNIYVGHTTQALSKRMEKHRSSMFDEKRGRCLLYQKMRELGVENFYIELLQKCPCDDIEELRQCEGEWIRKLGNLNMKVAGRTTEQYRKDTVEHKKEYDKKYREEHKQEISEKNKQKYKNDIEYQEQAKQRGKKRWENKKDEIKIQHKQYRDEHKEEMKEYKKKYNEEHKEELKEVYSKYYQDHRQEKIEYNKKYREEHKEEDKARRSIIHHCECGKNIYTRE